MLINHGTNSATSFESLEPRKLLSGAASGALTLSSAVTAFSFTTTTVGTVSLISRAVQLQAEERDGSSSGRTEVVVTLIGEGTFGGTIRFYDGQTLLETASVYLRPAGHHASLYAELPPGQHTIRVEYSGDATHDAAEATITINARRGVEYERAWREEDGKVRVRFTPVDGLLPTGTITFQSAHYHPAWSTSVTIVDGVAALDQVPPFPIRSLLWTYSGDATFDNQPSPRSVEGLPRVQSEAVTLSAVHDPANSTIGSQRFRVTIQDPTGLGSGEWFGGRIDAYVNGVLRAYAIVETTDPTSDLGIALTPGDHTIEFRYGGGTFHADATTTLQQTIGDGSIVGTELRLVAQGGYGSSGTLTATVTARDGTVPPGWIYFVMSHPLAGRFLARLRPDATGVATTPAPRLAGGSIYAAFFMGDDGYSSNYAYADPSSRSGAYDPTDIEATIALRPVEDIARGHPLVLRADVAKLVDDLNLQGVVYFFVDGKRYRSTTDVTPDGGVATVTVYGLQPGQHTIEAVYITARAPDDVSLPSTAMVTVLDQDVPLPPVPGGAQRMATADLDGNGSGDHIYLDATSHYVVRLTDSQGREIGETACLSPGSAWRLAGAGDLTGDGKSDLVWFHSPSRRAYVWAMNGAAVTGQQFIAASPQPPWRLAGVADLDGDGKADLLWTSDTLRKQSIWHMHGTAIRGFTMFNHALRQTAWVLDEVKDLDDDGDADLVWRNTKTDARFAWLLQGTTVVGGKIV